MKRKKQIEARLRACLAKYRWELWSEELSYDNQFPDCYEIPQKVEDEAMAKPMESPFPIIMATIVHTKWLGCLVWI